ncbi:MAG: hypothetical protein GY762_02400 [Proteobacteria bacterium]|nr:hypothetical protein [Pseudomonadota bacterium]
MKPFQPSLGVIVQINFKLLLATAMIFVAYYSWPTSAKWYGFGLISICAGLAAIGLVIEAVRAMAKLYARDKALENYKAQGGQTKSSEMASSDALDKAGMR